METHRTHSEQAERPRSTLPAPQRRVLSAGQVRAIFDAMRTFRDDDLGREEGAGIFICDRCGRARPRAGSVAYGELRLCNGCATDYELVRTAGLERDLLLAPENAERD